MRIIKYISILLIVVGASPLALAQSVILGNARPSSAPSGGQPMYTEDTIRGIIYEYDAGWKVYDLSPRATDHLEIEMINEVSDQVNDLSGNQFIIQFYNTASVNINDIGANIEGSIVQHNSPIAVHGIEVPSATQPDHIIIVNDSDHDITWTPESTAANAVDMRILGEDIRVQRPGESVTAVYVSNKSRWTLVGGVDQHIYDELVELRDSIINFHAILNQPPDPQDPAFYKAAGSVLSDGTLEQGAGATVTRVSLGVYDIAFNTPANTATYPVLATMQALSQNDDYQWAYLNRTVNGFRIEIREQDNGTAAGVLRDSGFSFFIPEI